MVMLLGCRWREQKSSVNLSVHSQIPFSHIPSLSHSTSLHLLQAEIVVISVAIRRTLHNELMYFMRDFI